MKYFVLEREVKEGKRKERKKMEKEMGRVVRGRRGIKFCM